MNNCVQTPRCKGPATAHRRMACSSSHGGAALFAALQMRVQVGPGDIAPASGASRWCSRLFVLLASAGASASQSFPQACGEAGSAGLVGAFGRWFLARRTGPNAECDCIDGNDRKVFGRPGRGSDADRRRVAVPDPRSAISTNGWALSNKAAIPSGTGIAASRDEAGLRTPQKIPRLD